MIKLDVKDYNKALGPLEKLTFNTIFAKTVIVQKIPSAVYVDDGEYPKSFYIAHPYGMSLLFGESRDAEFLEGLKDYVLNKKGVRSQREWLQFYPNSWGSVLHGLLGEGMLADYAEHLKPQADDSSKVLKSIRLNFEFDINRFKKLKINYNYSDCEVVSTTKEIFESFEGSVVPSVFWKDSSQFLTYGKGYTLICGGDAASTAFSSFADSGRLEIGIETKEAYRGRGFATEVSMALIDYCIANGLEPIWSCNITNSGSAALAQKLGFVKSVTLPYYRLIY